MNQYRMFFVQTFSWPPNMHQTLTKHGRFCKQNNHLPIKSHDELEDNCNVYLLIYFFVYYKQPLIQLNSFARSL